MVKIKQPRTKKRRASPRPDEINRINETLFNRAGFKIQDRDSYDLAFNNYLNIDEKTIKGTERKLRDNAFEDFIKEHPEVSSERLFTKKAGGKDLRRDRLKTAKRVVKTRKEFIQKGASKVDLKGFDTARQRVSKDIILRRTFTVPARVKGRVVFAVKTSVVVKGKKLTRFRDARGRFVSGRIK